MLVTEHHSVRNAAIGGTIALVVGTGVLALVPQAWPFVVTGVRWIGRTLAEARGIPVWVLLLTAGGLGVCLWLLRRAGRRMTPANEAAALRADWSPLLPFSTASVDPRAPVPMEPPALSELQTVVLTIFGKRGAQYLDRADLYRYVGSKVNHLLVDHALDQLEEYGLIKQGYGTDGPYCSLTKEGRARIVHDDLI